MNNGTLDSSIEKLSFDVIGAAIEVHKELGPGLFESTYQNCLAYELSQRGIIFKVQSSFPLTYKSIKFELAYRIDFLIENCLIVELKTVDSLGKIHNAQILTYMKLAKIPLGLLINFNSTPLKNGIKRFRL